MNVSFFIFKLFQIDPEAAVATNTTSIITFTGLNVKESNQLEL